MNLSDIRAQIEAEITWRRNELRFLSNLLLAMDKEEERAVFRKAIVVMLYAHFEGYCRSALTIYVRAINQEGLTCEQMNEALAAAVLRDVFAALHGGKKSDVFRKNLPQEEALHGVARQVEFLSVYPRVIAAQPALIPEDIVDAESNLKPVVLKKNLFRLGLSPNLFETHDGAINQLLRRRNDVAHGVYVVGLRHEDLQPLQETVFIIMDEIAAEIGRALESGAYRRAVA
jgi:hypothetical protein